MRLFLLVSLILVTALVLGTYVHRRVAEALRLGPAGRWTAAAVLVVAVVASFAGRVYDTALPRDVAMALGTGGSVVTLAAMISAVLLGVVDLSTWAARQLSRVGGGGAPRTDPPGSAAGPAERAPSIPAGSAVEEMAEPAADPAREAPTHPLRDGSPGTGEPGARTGRTRRPPTLPRRDALRRLAVGGALAVGAGASAYGVVLGRRDYELAEVPIPLPGLPPALDGTRIVQLSDVHFGTYVGDPELRSAVALARRARPDLIVLTGDLVDHNPAYAPQLGRLVRRLAELGPRHGVKVIPGNHDHYTGVGTVMGAAERGGGEVLTNRGVVLGDGGGAFALLGVDDVWARRSGVGPGPDLDRAIATVPADLPRVLLCHNPVFFPEARGRVGLQLSGHTHGGQVNLGFRPADLLLDYVHGLYEEEGSRLYVNRGFGTAGPPARVDARPEVTVVVLTSA
ncbi:MAG: metallophosphoesterase [Sandaracinaceae bacterium]